MRSTCWCILASGLTTCSQVIECGVASLVGTLWSGARAAAREARELAAALELEKAGRRAASMLDSGIEVRTCLAGTAGQGQVLLCAAALHWYRPNVHRFRARGVSGQQARPRMPWRMLACSPGCACVQTFGETAISLLDGRFDARVRSLARSRGAPEPGADFQASFLHYGGRQVGHRQGVMVCLLSLQRLYRRVLLYL